MNTNTTTNSNAPQATTPNGTTATPANGMNAPTLSKRYELHATLSDIHHEINKLDEVFAILCDTTNPHIKNPKIDKGHVHALVALMWDKVGYVSTQSQHALETLQDM